MTAAGFPQGFSGRPLSVLKVIRSNTDVNIRVNQEGLIHIHRSVSVERENLRSCTPLIL